ncbi:MAG: hypothetical protein LBS52_05250 [Dysgonamonadaceae bacterium]|nr:hypothetical protein [Dysgonamonadaceae bacterium]
MKNISLSLLKIKDAFRWNAELVGIFTFLPIDTFLRNVKAEKIAILDGVLCIKGNNKMYKAITERYRDYTILSTLVLRSYLYQI